MIARDLYVSFGEDGCHFKDDRWLSMGEIGLDGLHWSLCVLDPGLKIIRVDRVDRMKRGITIHRLVKPKQRDDKAELRRGFAHLPPLASLSILELKHDGISGCVSGESLFEPLEGDQ